MRMGALLLALWLLSMAGPHAWGAQAWWLDATGVSYDEECLLYCLQGMVNRDAPRLFLDTGSIFWQYPPSDQFWMSYLAGEKGFQFTQLDCLRAAIDRFKPHVKGLAVYESSRDASRYVALTLCAQRDLLPVTPTMLEYATPALRGRTEWARDDMSDSGLWRAYNVAVGPAQAGLKLTEADPDRSYGAIDRVVLLDVSRTPMLTVNINECVGKVALKINEGKAVDTVIQPEASFTGPRTYDLREKLERTAGRMKVRIFAVGEGARVTVGEVLFTTAEGLVPALEAKADIPCFAGLPIVEDLRGRFADDLVAHRWALEHLMPGCSRKLTFSAGHTHADTYLGGDGSITLGLDYPISQKAFVFNLSPIERPWHLKGKPMPGYPEQAELFDQIMQGLDSPAAVFGWAEPESVYCDRVSRNGNFVMCAAAPNLSFWAHVPVDETPRLPAGPAEAPTLQDKYYIAFQTNEGDTPKILAGLMAGGWLSDRRGTVPIAWGINPYIAELFPALFEFYATTATANDGFFAGCSGAGYCYPWKMPNFDEYAGHVARQIATHGPDVIDIWEGGLRLDMYERYRVATGARCFTQQTIGAATNNWLDDGTPVITADRSLFYYDLDAADPMGDMQRRLVEVAGANEPPFFILVYGGVGPGLFKIVAEMQRRLPGERFEVVGMRQMAELARQAGRLTVRAHGLGVSPGEAIQATVVARNPGASQQQQGRLVWELPEGWSAEPATRDHPAPSPGRANRRRFALRAGPRVGPQTLTVRDSGSGVRRRLRVFVYTDSQLVGDFSSAEGWRLTGASLSVEEGVGKITTPGPFAGIRRTVTVDFDRGPVLELRVPRSEGLWAAKLNDGTMPVDLTIQKDCKLTGPHAYDLAKLTRWRGKKQIQIILFAVAAGTSVYVDEVRIHYRR